VWWKYLLLYGYQDRETEQTHSGAGGVAGNLRGPSEARQIGYRDKCEQGNRNVRRNRNKGHPESWPARADIGRPVEGCRRLNGL
jgi:hypothetical protein